MPTIRYTITVDTSAFDVFRKKLSSDKIRRALQKTGARYLVLQRKNIRDGVEPDGSAFVEYDEEYRRIKTLAGRMTKGDSEAGSYWLRVTGQMLKSQRVLVSGGGNQHEAKVEFVGSHPRTYFKAASTAKNLRKRKNSKRLVRIGSGTIDNDVVAAGCNEKREFVGVDDDGAESLSDYFLARLGEYMGLDKDT